MLSDEDSIVRIKLLNKIQKYKDNEVFYIFDEGNYKPYYLELINDVKYSFNSSFSISFTYRELKPGVSII